MKLLVTGCAGDFGRDLVPLLSASHEVRATDLIWASPPCEFVQADLLDEQALPRLVEDREAVIHLAAKLPPVRPTTRECLDVNTTATALLMEAAARAQVWHFVYVSTIWATGHGLEEEMRPIDETAPANPVCVYGLTKFMGEIVGDYFARTTPMKVTVLRMCGYQRCPEIAPDGEIDWVRPDWAQLVLYLTRPGQKLFDPMDLVEVFEAALRLDAKFSRYLVGQQWPFQAHDAALLSMRPEQVWEKYYPGAAALFCELGVNPPELGCFYSVRRFAEATGWRQRISLGTLVRRYMAQRGEVL
jgi:nucleoside-diphosphate-sugar epimerase